MSLVLRLLSARNNSWTVRLWCRATQSSEKGFPESEVCSRWRVRMLKEPRIARHQIVIKKGFEIKNILKNEKPRVDLFIQNPKP